MPAPTANKTSHFNASDADHLWRAWQAGTPFHNGVPTHGQEVQVWDDEDARDMSWLASTSLWPFWNATSPAMRLPSLKFDPSAIVTHDSRMKLWNHAATTAITMTPLFASTAWVVGCAFRLFAGSTNDANPLNNEGLIVGDGGFWGIYIRNAGGVYSLMFYNFTSAAHTVTLGALSANVDYVLIYWRTGNTIFAEIYNAGGLVTSGSTASSGPGDRTGQWILGMDSTALHFASVYVGEVLSYNAYVLADKSALVTYLTGKWFTVAAPPLPVLSTMTPNSAYASASAPVNLTAVAFTGQYLDGTGGAFNAIAGFTFSGLSIASGGASGTVNIQIATAKAPGAYTFLYTTTGGTSSGTTLVGVTFTVLASPVTLTSMTPNSAYVNAAAPVKLLGVAFTGTSLDGPSGAFDGGGGFVFTNLVIAAGGASGTVDLQIAAGKPPGNYNFVFTTAAGTSLPLVFTVSAPAAGGGDTGGLTRFNVGLN